MRLIASAASQVVASGSAGADLAGGAMAGGGFQSLMPPPPPLEPWLCSLRAVNLAQAIQQFLALPPPPPPPPSSSLVERSLSSNLGQEQPESDAAGGGGSDVVLELWPHMVALVCSPHAVVRHAVADYFGAGVARAAMGVPLRAKG